jgi:hypothetical protein
MQGIKKEEIRRLTRIYRLEETLALKKNRNEQLDLSGRKTLREGIVLQTNYIAGIGKAI